MMKIDWSFPRQVFLSILILGCAGIYPALKFGNGDFMRAAVAGVVLATVNVLLGFAAVEYAFGKSTTIFMKYVLGGMGIRLFGMAVILVGLIKIVHLDAAVLVTTLGIFYVVFLTLEILFIQKKVSIHHHN